MTDQPASAPAPRLLGIGECMVEMAPRAGGGFAMGFAGDTFNTCWYAARLGRAAHYLTAVGDDAVSGQMLDFMRDAGVTPHAAIRSGRSVGLYLISLSNGERSFSYWRDTSAARTLADELTALPAVEAGDIALISGITLAILTPQARASLISCLITAREAGVRVAFDPNIRPRLWPDAATLREAITDAARVSDIVLPSFEDEAAAFGDGAPEATAERYGDLGAGCVVVKDGAGPITLREGTQTRSLTPGAVAEIVDTTAAGDSFNAAFLEGVMAGHDAAEAVQAGARLAARVIGARGALVPV